MTSGKKSWLRRELKWNHISLILGFLLACASFFWHGRQEDTRILMLVLGVSVSIISMIVTIAKKATGINKLNWLVVTGFLIAGSMWLAPRLTELSYHTYYNQHKTHLDLLRDMMAEQPGEVNVFFGTAYAEDWDMTLENEDEWIELREALNAESLHKVDNEIRVTLDGYRFSGKGLTYSMTGDYPIVGYDDPEFLVDNWYFSD